MDLGLLRRFLYYPEPLAADAPLPPHAAAAEQVFRPTGDGQTVHALWWAPAPGRPTILYFHGNAGHVYDWALVRGELQDAEAGLLLPDYHGYGKSSGRPTEAGLYHDARACAAFLAERGVRPEDTVLLGKSLGGGVAAELARELSAQGRPPRGLVLESTFTSMGSVAQRLVPYLPVAGLVPDRYESAAKLAEIACPVFVIHGALDGLIPPAEGQALFDRARPPKRLWLVPDADHNDVSWVAGSAYGRRLRAFLDDPRAEGGA
jgi:hypothetical protein